MPVPAPAGGVLWPRPQSTQSSVRRRTHPQASLRSGAINERKKTRSCYSSDPPSGTCVANGGRNTISIQSATAVAKEYLEVSGEIEKMFPSSPHSKTPRR